MSAQPGHAFGVKLIEATGSDLCIHHQPGVLKHLQVLRDSGPAHGQRLRQFIDGNGSRGKLLEDSHARCIAQGIQSGL